eukprot:1273363-Ditylum_brightwellii.AAC.1
MSMCILHFTSFSSLISGIASLIACDIAMYSASIVPKVISVCNFEVHTMGQLAYFMMKPVLGNTDEGSALQACCQSPANDASTNTSKPLLISGLMFSPYIGCSLPDLGLVVNKYLTTCFTALS